MVGIFFILNCQFYRPFSGLAPALSWHLYSGFDRAYIGKEGGGNLWFLEKGPDRVDYDY